ncbi:hypothetical protein AWW66_27280 [Micromonospora rosaria]|uniref:Uncharacterized protein n=1 Tax=Micromonospora rosaria TaxID=47874 RepID=A0A136PKK3_9ACTN|nr:hypothetical protein [Micromonospora rosaria]KXK58891.1 hypothetical protein AWW66_27280 [Micromonospora rosaria]
MSVEAGGWGRSALLFGVVLVTLVGGGVWWRANAPGSAPAPAVASPPELIRVEPGGSARIVFDSRTGQVTGSTRTLTRGFGTGYPGFGPAAGDRVTIARGESVSWEFTPGLRGRYVVQYRCTGSRLWVWTGRDRVTEADRSACDGELAQIGVPAGAGPVSIRMGTYRRGTAEVQIQVVAVPGGHAVPGGQRTSATRSAR